MSKQLDLKEAALNAFAALSDEFAHFQFEPEDSQVHPQRLCRLCHLLRQICLLPGSKPKTAQWALNALRRELPALGSNPKTAQYVELTSPFPFPHLTFHLGGI